MRLSASTVAEAAALLGPPPAEPFAHLGTAARVAGEIHQLDRVLLACVELVLLVLERGVAADPLRLRPRDAELGEAAAAAVVAGVLEAAVEDRPHRVARLDAALEPGVVGREQHGLA